MKMKKSTLIVVILIVLAIIGITVYSIMTTEKTKVEKEEEAKKNSNYIEKQEQQDKKDEEQPNETNNTENVKNEKVELTKQELDEFTENLGATKIENNVFLTCEYNKIEDIDLSKILYSGAGIEITGENVNKEYKEVTGEDGLGVSVIKLKSDDINAFLKEKTGKTFDIKSKLSDKIVYSSKYDAYYVERGDTNLALIECTKGSKTSDGKYVIEGKYKDLRYNSKDEEVKSFIVTLQKNDNGYMFISNEMK